jgi:hypothetical protein
MQSIVAPKAIAKIFIIFVEQLLALREPPLIHAASRPGWQRRGDRALFES